MSAVIRFDLFRDLADQDEPVVLGRPVFFLHARSRFQNPGVGLSEIRRDLAHSVTEGMARTLAHHCILEIEQGPRKETPILSPNRPARHIARFMLVGAYTGTRASAIAGAAFEPTPGCGWIDLKTGLYYRKDQSEIETNKRQPTILIPRRLLMHSRRWKRAKPDQKFVVEFRASQSARSIRGSPGW